MNSTESKEALQEAIDLAGGQTSLAEKLFGDPEKRPRVQQWLRNRLPPDYVLPVARAVDFRVTPHRLAPDIYPNERDGLPDSAIGVTQ